jgi:DNA-binding PadR family transcriptional regulator
MEDLRITVAVARVLREFLADPSQARHGYELMQLTGFPSGKLYPVLVRLHRAGLLIREREDVDPRLAGRPARYLYRLAPDAIESVRYELAVLSEQLRPAFPQLPGRHVEGHRRQLEEVRPRLQGGAA